MLFDWSCSSKLVSGHFSVEDVCTDCFRIVLSISEDCKVLNVIDGSRRSFTPRVGNLTILPAGCSYREEISGNGSAILYEFAWPGYMQFCHDNLHFDPSSLVLVPRVSIRDKHLTKILLELSVAKLKLQNETMCDLLYHLTEFHSNRSKQASGIRISGGLTPLQLRRSIDAVEYKTNTITLDDMYKESGLSKYHFIRAFRKSLGITPHQYIIRRRLENSLILLTTADKDLDEIAHGAGFANGDHLTKMLKRHFGVTANQFRKVIIPQSLCVGDLIRRF